MGDSPEQQQDGSRAEQSRHHVDGHCRRCDVTAEKRDEKTPGEHEDRVARRMADFELECLEYKFGTVPETCCGLDGEQIGHGCDDKTQPSERVVDEVVTFHASSIGSRVKRFNRQSYTMLSEKRTI
jgi:hypothetical protein